MKNYSGLDFLIDKEMQYHYGEGVFGPKAEIRHLDDIRASLENPQSEGPNQLYSIAMGVGYEKDRQAMLDRNLLYGVVYYAAGQIGDEPIRSQGHIHSISASCNDSTCEVYEILDGEAYIYMQESSSDDAGRCYAVHAKRGDVVIVPPGWVHATINADVTRNMMFGAWCVRDFGFEYAEVREHHGIAYFPKVKEEKIQWEFNPAYKSGNIEVIPAFEYPQFHIKKGKPIYTQFQEDPDCFLFVSRPELAKNEWEKM